MNHIHEIIDLYLTAYAQDKDIGTAALRALRNDPACRFYANEGNDYVILNIGNKYVAIGMTNQLFGNAGIEKIENGIGTVILHETYGSYKDALNKIMEVMLIDAE